MLPLRDAMLMGAASTKNTKKNTNTNSNTERR